MPILPSPKPIAATGMLTVLAACVPVGTYPTAATAIIDTPAPATIPMGLIARGTEPFWAIEIDRERLAWRTPDQPEGRRMTVRRMPQPDGLRYIGGDADGPFVLEVRPARCSDGMSDLVYDYAATWTYRGQVLRGCALQRD